MQLTIKKNNIESILKMVGQIAPNKATNEIYTNMQVAIQNNKLSMTCASGKTEAAFTMPLTGIEHKEGSVAVNAKKLLGIVHNLPEGANLNLKLNDKGKLIVSSGRSRFTLSTLPASDFPIMETPKSEVPKQFKVIGHKFAKAMSRVMFAMANGDVRDYMNGIFLEIKNGQVSLVATDGHRLSKAIVSEAQANTENASLIIPRASVLELHKLASFCKAEVTFELKDRHFVLDAGALYYKTNLCEGKYPDYERIVPNRNEGTSASFPRNELKSTLHRAGLLADEKYSGIRMNMTQGKAKLVSMERGVDDESLDEMDIHYDGNDFSIGFNQHYMSDIISSSDAETIEGRFYGEQKAMRLDFPESNHFAVLMPMKDQPKA